MKDDTNYTMALFSDDSLWQDGSALFNNTSPNNTTVLLISPMLDNVISIAIIIVLFITLVSLGCTMHVDKIKAHILKPKGVAIAVVSQYGIMPLSAFCLTKVFQMGSMEAVTVLICGCCPGGSLSNILALALQGDMNLSIVMTTCSTLLALGMMPLLLYLYCQGYSNLESAVPYTGITLALVMTLVPCGIGILINYYRPQYSNIITKVGLSIMFIFVMFIGIGASVLFGGVVLSVLSPSLIATAALMPLIGYTFGYGLSAVFKINQSGRRTVAMETGCQNIQLCLTILKVAFPAEVIGPLYLFPIVYIVFQVTEAFVLILLFRCHQRLTAPAKEKQMYQMATGQPEDKKEPNGV